MKAKKEVLDIFQSFQVGVERLINKLLNYLRTDNGGEYCSNSFKDYCNKFDIKHKKNFPGIPQQNVTA